MLGNNHKKRNEIAKRGDETVTAPPAPVTIPPMRTFVLRNGTKFDPITNLPVPDEREVDAHGLAIDESRMLSFVVFYFLGGDTTKPTSTTKLAVNADSWTEVEEINLEFPTIPKH